jgi:hypothetical protein
MKLLKDKFNDVRNEFINALKNYGEFKNPIRVQLIYDDSLYYRTIIKIKEGVMYYLNEDEEIETEYIDMLSMNELYQIYLKLND